MPFLKLWNSIRGRSVKGASSAATTAGSENRAPQRSAKRSKAKRTIFRGGPHAGLRKLVKPHRAKSVLEISVGDGSRAIALAETLGEIRYYAIDHFEMSGGDTTLKQFYQTLRGAGIRPHVFPDSIEQGLMRFAHTVGKVDLILIATSPESWPTSRRTSLIGRITHENTLILQFDGESWRRFELLPPPARGAA